MFDGNHRSRRNINLGGTRRRNARRPISSNKSSSNVVNTTNRSGSTNAGIMGIPNTKLALLETARLQREERYKKQKQLDAATELQRLYRGWKCRYHLALEFRDKYYKVSSSNEQKEEEKKKSLQTCVSIGAFLLSPPLLPFLSYRLSCTTPRAAPATKFGENGENNKILVKPCQKGDSDEVVWGMLLSLCSKVEWLTNHQKEGSTKAASFTGGSGNSSTTSNSPLEKESALNVARMRYAYARIANTSLILLRSFASLLSSATDHSRKPSNLQDASNLTSLVQFLLNEIYNLPSTSTTSAESNITNTRHHRDNYQEVILSLFLCFKDWFWSATNTISTTAATVSFGDATAQQLKLMVQTIAVTLLHLSCRVAGTLEKQQQQQQRDTACAIDAQSILAACIFCSKLDISSANTMVEEGSRTLNKHSLKDGKMWKKELEACSFYFPISTESHDDESNYDNNKSTAWYISLLDSLLRTLVYSNGSNSNVNSDRVSTSVTRNANADSTIIIEQIVKQILSGRECILLFNALTLYSSISPTDSTKTKLTDGTLRKQHVSLSFTIVQLLYKILLHSSDDSRSNNNLKILTVLSGLVANGEDLTFLNVSPNKVTDVIDLTGDNEDNSTEDSDEEGSEDENDGGTRGGHEPNSTATSATALTTTYASLQSQQQSSPAIQKHYKSSDRQTKRQDLQTVPKLDRLYQSEVAKERKDILTQLKDRMEGNTKTSSTSAACTMSSFGHVDITLFVKVASDIGSGPLMQNLGSTIFNSDMNTVTGASERNMSLVREAYCGVLSILLQYCTGAKPRNSAGSPLLSKLAFHSNFLEGVWDYAKDELKSLISNNSTQKKRQNDGFSEYSSKSLNVHTVIAAFCDLFAHHLLAMDDEEFLASYTNQQTLLSKIQSKIRAEDIVLNLRGILYELYWSKPVVVKDVIAPSNCWYMLETDMLSADVIERCHRTRLLLSGTKLWNALYERWCRLFRSNPWCDEECWWFPRLVTREYDEEGAVVGGTAGADGDGMVLDDDDSAASPMDIDDSDNEGEHAVSSRRTTAADEENEALASSFRDPKMARILTSIPQSLPFDRRVKLFNSLLNADKANSQDETIAFRNMVMNMSNGSENADFTGRERVQIRRDALYEDSMDQLNTLRRKLRKKVQVTFINQHGAHEAGIDGGGVFKEFLDDLIKDAFDPYSKKRNGVAPLFIESPTQTLSVNVGPNPSVEILSHYEFLGRVLGKAVYESILVEPQFCLPFLNQLLGNHNTLDDLKNIDPEYYRHLSSLRHMSEEDIDSMGLTFELTTTGTSEGIKSRTIELIPGGSSMQVTKFNVIRYVHLVAHRRLNLESSIQTQAFLRGFRDLIPAAWVRLFSAYELQKLIGGDDSVKGIDVEGIKLAMQYAGGYHPSQPIIKWLWEVVEEMSTSQQRKFLKFMTSCSRQPLLGFQALVPLPCIQQIRLSEETNTRGSENTRLPTSSTCMNLLKLPNYKTKELLREKLLYAIEAGAGFELS